MQHLGLTSTIRTTSKETFSARLYHERNNACLEIAKTEIMNVKTRATLVLLVALSTLLMFNDPAWEKSHAFRTGYYF